MWAGTPALLEPVRDAPATDWGGTPNTVNFRKIRVDQANRSETSTEDTDTTEDTDFQLFTVLSVDFSSSVVHHSRTCQTVRLRPILTALGGTPKATRRAWGATLSRARLREHPPFPGLFGDAAIRPGWLPSGGIPGFPKAESTPGGTRSDPRRPWIHREPQVPSRLDYPTEVR